MIDTLLPVLAVLVIAGASSVAFAIERAGQPIVLWSLLLANALLAAVSLWRMWRDGTLLDLFRWRRGDITLGFLVALGLAACTFAGRQMVAPPGTSADSWVVRLYLQLGPPPASRQAGVAFLLAIVAVTVAEEVVWRGMVQQILEEKFGVRVGWIAAAVLYALAHLPTLWLMAMPPVGKNPLVMLAALFCGAVWGFLVARKQRLAPALVSHAIFTYALTAQFRLWTP
ncbi:MAG: CPBP family intramembrane metalloprotease [Myxococcales bacterium]|nr:MAG: CPBP family intramembrane metalloprotease [Myxococcales bacterium]